MSIAPVSHAASGWTNAAKIVSLNQQPVNANGSELVFVELSLTTNPSGCSINFYHFAVSSERLTRIFSMLLAAQLADRSVQLFFTGTCGAPVQSALIDGAIVLQN